MYSGMLTILVYSTVPFNMVSFLQHNDNIHHSGSPINGVGVGGSAIG